jgi:hypothetical protein
VTCHHAKTKPSVMAGHVSEGNHQRWGQPSVMAGQTDDGKDRLQWV